ncbi:MAG: hypothetical protein ACYDCW_01770 [Acidithiobacillus ferrivorans]
MKRMIGRITLKLYEGEDEDLLTWYQSMRPRFRRYMLGELLRQMITRGDHEQFKGLLVSTRPMARENTVYPSEGGQKPAPVQNSSGDLPPKEWPGGLRPKTVEEAAVLYPPGTPRDWLGLVIEHPRGTPYSVKELKDLAKLKAMSPDGAI